MGIKGKGKKSTKQTGESSTRAINPTWWECTPAFYAEAVNVLEHRDEHLKARDYDDTLEGDDGEKARQLCDRAKLTQDRLRRYSKSIAAKYRNSPLAHHLAGHSRMALGKPDQALPYLKIASGLQPSCLEIAHSVAAAYAELEQFGLAADECRRALAVDDPTDPLLHTVLEVPSKPSVDADKAKVRVAVAKERLRGLLADVKALPCSIHKLRKLWKGMSEDIQRSFLNINIGNLQDYFRIHRQGHVQRDTIDSGLDFVKATQSWIYWICPCCKDGFLDPEMLWLHIQERHVHGLKEILVNVPEKESCKDAGSLLTFDESRQLTLDQAHMIIIPSPDDKLTMPNEDDASLCSLQTLLRQPMGEESWTKLRQDCLNMGDHAISEIQSMVNSLRKKCTLSDGDSSHQKASMDVLSGVEHLKTKLVEACKFDYYSIIFPAVQIYLTAKLNDMAAEHSEEHANKQDSLEEQPSKDQVPVVLENVQVHGESSSLPNPTSGMSYSGATQEQRQKEEDEKVVKEFAKHLKDYKRDESEEPFYFGELKGMISRKGKTFSVYYTDVERHNKKLSNDLQRLYGRIRPRLQIAVQNFMAEMKLLEECIQISPNCPQQLRIHGLPFPSRKLADFLRVESNKLTEVVYICKESAETALDTTQLGRDLFLGYLCYMMEKHRAGKAWNGDFCIDDLQVMDGCIFRIAKDTTVHASRRAMAADMKKLVELLMQYYRTSSVSLPCYFTELQSDMENCFESLGKYNSVETMKFHKYLKSHLALKSAMARGHLFLDLYRIRLLISKVDFINLQAIIRSPEIDWITEAMKHHILLKILDEGFDKRDIRTDTTTQSTPAEDSKNYSSDKGKDYSDSLDHLLLFVRHVVQHGADRAKNDNEQKLENLTSTDLIVGKYLADCVMKLFKTLWKGYDMKSGMQRLESLLELLAQTRGCEPFETNQFNVLL